MAESGSKALGTWRHNQSSSNSWIHLHGYSCANPTIGRFRSVVAAKSVTEMRLSIRLHLSGKHLCTLSVCFKMPSVCMNVCPCTSPLVLCSTAKPCYPWLRSWCATLLVPLRVCCHFRCCMLAKKSSKDSVQPKPEVTYIRRCSCTQEQLIVMQIHIRKIQGRKLRQCCLTWMIILPFTDFALLPYILSLQ